LNAINRYFRNIYEETKTENLDEIAERYFDEKSDYKKDIQSFVHSLSDLTPLQTKI